MTASDHVPSRIEQMFNRVGGRVVALRATRSEWFVNERGEALLFVPLGTPRQRREEMIRAALMAIIEERMDAAGLEDLLRLVLRHTAVTAHREPLT